MGALCPSLPHPHHLRLCQDPFLFLRPPLSNQGRVKGVFVSDVSQRLQEREEPSPAMLTGAKAARRGWERLAPGPRQPSFRKELMKRSNLLLIQTIRKQIPAGVFFARLLCF